MFLCHCLISPPSPTCVTCVNWLICSKENWRKGGEGNDIIFMKHLFLKIMYTDELCNIKTGILKRFLIISNYDHHLLFMLF